MNGYTHGEGETWELAWFLDNGGMTVMKFELVSRRVSVFVLD